MEIEKENFNAVIIEDEPQSSKRLCKVIEENFPELDICGCAESVSDGARLICDAEPDMVFLDIEIKGGDGFAVLEAIPEEKRNFSLIFVTGFHQFALDAFRVNAVSYIIKPYDDEELAEAIGKAVELRRQQREYAEQRNKISQLLNYIDLIQHNEEKISLEAKEKTLFVRLNQILYCESDHNYTIFHLMDGSLRVRGNISDFEEKLCRKNFFRTHRRYIVNLAFVKEVRKINGDGEAEGKIILNGGVELELSRSKRAELIELLRKNSL